MPRTPRWTEAPIEDGIGEYRLSSWKYFTDFVDQQMLDHRGYIWRGQRCDDWLLQPGLERRLERFPVKRRTSLRRLHLESFQYAVRGRRGPNPPRLESDNDWWALGQHHGLYTPLLDWTRSPFGAAYFAFFDTGAPQTQRRALYALHQDAVERRNRELRKTSDGDGNPPCLEFIRPFSDDNPRLVNQAGLFTRAPDGIDIVRWVKEQFAGVSDRYILMKVTIPNADRDICLRSLNRMNINHLTLFPDLIGASLFCNVDLEIDRY